MINPEQSTEVNAELMGMILDADRVIRAPESPVKRTRITFDEHLSERYGAEIYLASETHQLIRAFKIRGAYNFVQHMTPSERQRGVVTASAGNHAQGIALSTNMIGVKSHIFMPAETPKGKWKRTEELGGETTTIHRIGKTFDDCEKLAKQHCKQTGAVFAHPFNDKKVIAGQGTWGLEVNKKIPDLDFVFCPVGGMGLLAGISTAIKNYNPEAKIMGVEPMGAASLHRALDIGKADYIRKDYDTLVDGAAVRRVGRIPFMLAHQLIYEAVAVDNEDLRGVTTELWARNKRHSKVELAGALAIAGLQRNRGLIRGKKVVCMVSGANLDKERYDSSIKSTNGGFLRPLY